MPQVDFYILDRDADDARLSVACRIAEKAMQGDMRVFVRATDAREASRLDEMLWTFSQGSFVPHRIGTGTAVEPVLISAAEPDVDAQFDVLINLAPTMPVAIDRYTRIAELVDANDERRQLGRERFRQYRDSGCNLESHRL